MFRAFSIFACVIGTVGTAAATDLTRYRDFQLGSSVATIQGLTAAANRDLHARIDAPVRVQELDWYVPSATPGVDAVRQIRFEFVGDQLFRMTVTYDERRTAGLTHGDVVVSLEPLYGRPSNARLPVRRPFESAAPAVVAQWTSAAVKVSLEHTSYLGAYTLQLTSIPLELAARKAETLANAYEAREAPRRAAARAKERAEEDRLASEKARTENKAGFRP